MIKQFFSLLLMFTLTISNLKKCDAIEASPAHELTDAIESSPKCDTIEASPAPELTEEEPSLEQSFDINERASFQPSEGVLKW